MTKIDKNAELYASPVTSSASPISYDSELCIGCNKCADACQVDVLVYSENKGEHPIVMYPGECYYCGACVMECPVKGAIKLRHPLMNQAKFIPVKK
jgi:MinD superfamily P-loop ATPase containing an inserted ferredoxin domain